MEWSISEGSLGAEPKPEYRSAMMESGLAKSRNQNFSMISRVEAGREEAASGWYLQSCVGTRFWWTE